MVRCRWLTISGASGFAANSAGTLGNGRISSISAACAISPCRLLSEETEVLRATITSDGIDGEGPATADDAARLSAGVLIEALHTGCVAAMISRGELFVATGSMLFACVAVRAIILGDSSCV
jgi:hypothetical protein